MEKYDVIVLGGGSAGLTCAIGAAKLGKKTLLVEDRKLGGECTWSGCIPSKAFIGSGSLAAARAVSEAVYHHETPKVLQGYGVDTLMERGEFTGPRTLRAGGKLFSADTFVLATGSMGAVPPVKGLKDIPYLTTESFFQLKELPKSIVFIGAGIISLELAFPLAKNGVKVTLVEKEKTLLPREDPVIRQMFESSLKEHGITCMLGTDILEISPEGSGAFLRCTRGGTEVHLETEAVLVSAGRVARVEGFGLDGAGVAYTKAGVKVNPHMQTSQSHIYAAGDCVEGGYRFSHIAGRHGEVITRNIAFPWIKASFREKGAPFIMFGQPEYARCGLTETEALAAYGDIRVYEASAGTTDRAISSFDKHFLLRVFCRGGLIVGAYCTGQRAGEIIAPLQFLMGAKIPFRKYAGVIQAYPGYGEVIRRLAKAAMIDGILGNPVVKLFRK